MRKIYLASPFFNEEEIEEVSKAETILRERGYEVFSPREHEVRDESMGTYAWSRKTFVMDIMGIVKADCLVMLYWGNYSDTGTAWECGFAYAKEKPVIVVHMGESSNLMVHEGSHTNLTGVEALKDYDFDSMSQHRYSGKMF
ncbi:MAG: nucleoside 2-deoxyribosyltransferase [Eubacterium sp.]|nr:nucleoside 2-deoxyribosyltransferase [Eubacterium sp.]